MSPVLLLLVSGIFHTSLATHRLRNFTLLKDLKDPKRANWQDAQHECSKTNQSLVTVYDREDIEFVDKLVSKDPFMVWLGLQRSLHNVSTWSDGTPYKYNQSNANVTNAEQRCEAIDNDVWTDFSCSETKSFMCYRGSKYSLIDKKMNWCRAQAYCREHFTDLVSISNSTQNEQVLSKGRNKTFWIGLMHDEWKWADQGCSTYREWNNKGVDNCTQVQEKRLYRNQCTNELPILCSTGVVRIIVIKENFTWEQAFDYCRAHHSRLLQIEDEKDQDSVKRRLTKVDHGTDMFWIGLRQSRVFGFWIWADKPVVYNNWQNGIPEMPMSDNCGVVETGNYAWRDESCWKSHPFLCEENISYMRKLS